MHSICFYYLLSFFTPKKKYRVVRLKETRYE